MREAKLWTLHMISGVLLVFLLGAHMAVMHLDDLLRLGGGDPLAWGEVLQRAQSVGYLITYLLLLTVGLYHGLYGLRSMLLEIPMSLRTQGVLTRIIVIGGLLLWGYGVLTAWVAFARGA